MFARTFAAVLLLLVAGRGSACSMQSWQPDDLVDNRPDVSANGRFTAVVRWYPTIPDFTTVRADKVFRFGAPDEEGGGAPPRRETVVAALYEGRRPIAEVRLDAGTTDYVLVSDSGRFLVAIGGGRPCGGRAPAEEVLITIYQADGARVSRRTLADVLSPPDAAQWLLDGQLRGIALRQEGDGREVVVLTFPGPGTKDVERRIELATGALLDERRDIFPSPRVFVTPVRTQDSPHTYLPATPDCTAAFADAPHLVSERFFLHALETPLPPFPPVAIKARIRGAIRLELLVSETGDVLCLRRSSLPFGIDGATDASVPRWKFEPYVLDGRAVKFAGELLLHFEDAFE